MPADRSRAISPTQWLLLLHSIPYVGEKTLTRLLRWNALNRVTPEACLALSAAEWRDRYDLDPRAIAHLCDEQDALLRQSTELLRALHTHPIHLLTGDSRLYPERLERFDDVPPPILYALGNVALLQSDSGERFTFTVAVSNGAKPDALARQDTIANALIAAGGVPVTGHDRTAYKRLALTAQRQNRSVCYVFDRGLREALGPQFDRPPFSAARIRDAVFDVARDVALSPFRLDDHMIGANNKRRDRMVFALADLIVALDVAPGGGMEAECLRANGQGKPVVVLAGGRDGNARLREQGCPEGTSAPDVTEIAAGIQAAKSVKAR